MTDDIIDEWRQRPCGCVEKKVPGAGIDFGDGVSSRWVLDWVCVTHRASLCSIMSMSTDFERRPTN